MGRLRWFRCSGTSCVQRPTAVNGGVTEEVDLAPPLWLIIFTAAMAPINLNASLSGYPILLATQGLHDEHNVED